MTQLFYPKMDYDCNGHPYMGHIPQLSLTLGQLYHQMVRITARFTFSKLQMHCLDSL